MNPCNIMFSSAGRRVALIRHFRDSLDALGLPGRIITADLKENAPAHQVSDAHEIVPSVQDPSYISVLLGLCKKHDIRLLVPLIDSELLLLSEHREEFYRIGTMVLVSSKDTNVICHDKRNTYKFFEEIGAKSPKILDPQSLLLSGPEQFPVFLKPARGSSSIGTRVIYDTQELEFFLKYTEDPIVQELISGEEYTVDVFVDLTGKVRTAVPRKRLETRAGEVSKGVTIRNEQIMKEAVFVVESLPGAVGCITVQCFLTTDGDVYLIEINPRFGGGVPLSIHAGADFPKGLIQLLQGLDPQHSLNQWESGVQMLRYDEAFFLHGQD